MSDSRVRLSQKEWKAKRRRERWRAFLNPFITMASIVISIGLLMFFIRTCSERNPGLTQLLERGRVPPASIPPAR